jgi:hypothetical protein
LTNAVLTAIKLERRSELIFRVLDREHGHIGNLKFASGAWKFKAIGYEPGHVVIPGGGPFTHRHNAIVSAPDAAELIHALK